jgi:spore maturation protein CgeB
MLHEFTRELAEYFMPGTEVATFSGVDELAGVVCRLLEDPALRDSLRIAGHRRCVNAPYTYSSAVQVVIDYHIAFKGRCKA